MKKGKELKIKSFNDYNIVYGSVDNKNSKALYINISTWVEPLIDDDSLNYNRVIKNINKSIKQNLYNKLYKDQNNFIHNKTIVDLDMRKSGLKFGKRSFVNCEVTLFLKEELPINDMIMRPLLDEILEYIIDTTFKKNKYFKFHKKK